MGLKWFPWQFIVKQVARSKGFIDPILLLSHFNRFAQPSEVWAPVELLRAGTVLHARGLINSQVIQHNLDWVWPLLLNDSLILKTNPLFPGHFHYPD